MNPALEGLKRELADKDIHDPQQREIFLTKATQYKMWANYIAGLILTNEDHREFHITDIRRVLKRLLGNLYDGHGAKESAILTQDMADTSNCILDIPVCKKWTGKEVITHSLDFLKSDNRDDS